VRNISKKNAVKITETTVFHSRYWLIVI